MAGKSKLETMEVRGYEGLELIGSGGNAHVYRATEVETGEVFAVKVLRGGGDESVIRRFERERTLMSELETISNVVSIHESGVGDTGDPFIVMPLFTGGSLQGRLEEGPMPWQEALDVVETLASSIAMAHAKRILHLDIKPANVLLDEEGNPWLADFGIAELMGHTTSMSAKMMTPAFTPPERLNGAKPTEQTDLYGLMAMLFALLTGQAPYVTDASTGPMGVMIAIMRDPLPLDLLPQDIPEVVRNLLARGMAKDPSVRPSSATELQGLIADARAGRAVAAPDMETIVRPAMQSPVETLDPTSVTQSPISADTFTSVNTVVRPKQNSEKHEATPIVEPDTKDRRLFAVAGVVAVIVLVTAGAFTLLGGDDDTAESSAATDTGESEVDETSNLAESVEVEVLDESVTAELVADSDDSDGGDEAEEGTPIDTTDDEVASQEVADDLAEVAGTDRAAPASSEEAPAADEAASTAAAAVVVTTTTVAPAPTTTRAAVTTSTRAPANTTSAPTTTAVPVSAGFIAPPGANQTMTFDNTTSGDATSYRWDFGDGGSSTSFEPTHTFPGPGRYDVTITATGPGGTNSFTATVRVDPVVVVVDAPNAGWIAAPPQPGNEQTMFFQNNSSGEFTSVLWDFGDGTSSTAFAPSHFYSVPGRYDVTLTVTGPGGSDSFTATIRADPNS